MNEERTTEGCEMTRQVVREMKKCFHAGSSSCASDEQRLHGQEAALSLLARSVHFGHGRLAVIRLHAAVRAGAVVPEAYWRHCHKACRASKDASVQALYLASVRMATALTAGAQTAFSGL